MYNFKKTELYWIGKEERFQSAPQVLLYNKEKSYGDVNTENMLVHGDNLLALKALEQDFTNSVKCIYIDPPYNTGSAFEHYDDKLEHSLWLSLMRDRLEVLRNLLKEDGSIWISIDADESHYLKVLCDEVFGRQNFVDEVVWQRSYSPINLKKTLSRSHDTILVYAKNKTSKFDLNKLPRSKTANSRYKNPDNDPRGDWTSGDISVGPVVEKKVYEITTPSGRKVLPPKGYCWRLTKERFEEYVLDNRIWFGKDGNNTPRIKRFLSETKQGITSTTFWTRHEIGDNQEAKKEIKALNFESIFDTPKSERLISRILTLASDEGDLVLDSFLGSGTTAAVAHKMGRKYIGIELGDHCFTHCKPRLEKVIDGEQGGISKTINWQGGGGFGFFELANALINEDDCKNQVINPELYNPNTLAFSVAKFNAYSYNPSCETFWKQGSLGDNQFIFTTTLKITHDYLSSLSNQMQEGEKLLICCNELENDFDFENIKIIKIPENILINSSVNKNTSEKIIHCV